MLAITKLTNVFHTQNCHIHVHVHVATNHTCIIYNVYTAVTG